MLKKILFSIILIVASAEAFSANVNHTGKVSRIYPTGAGAIYFQLYQETGCAPLKPNHYYVVQPSKPGFDEYYALLLAAAHSDKSIYVNVSDDACSNSSQATSDVRYIFQDF